jgi:hypothetical protein
MRGVLGNNKGHSITHLPWSLADGLRQPMIVLHFMTLHCPVLHFTALCCTAAPSQPSPSGPQQAVLSLSLFEEEISKRK